MLGSKSCIVDPDQSTSILRPTLWPTCEVSPRNCGEHALEATEPVLLIVACAIEETSTYRLMEELQRRCAPEVSPSCANMDSRTPRPGNNAACSSASDISATSSESRPRSSAAASTEWMLCQDIPGWTRSLVKTSPDYAAATPASLWASPTITGTRFTMWPPHGGRA